MSNKIIVLWGVVIVALVSSVYFIGIKYQNELKYISLKTEVKEATKKYIEDKKVSLPFKIETETLESEGYIGALKLEEKVCAADVSVDKKLFFYSYDIKFLCVNTEQNKD